MHFFIFFYFFLSFITFSIALYMEWLWYLDCINFVKEADKLILFLRQQAFIIMITELNVYQSDKVVFCADLNNLVNTFWYTDFYFFYGADLVKEDFFENLQKFEDFCKSSDGDSRAFRRQFPRTKVFADFNSLILDPDNFKKSNGRKLVGVSKSFYSLLDEFYLFKTHHQQLMSKWEAYKAFEKQFAEYDKKFVAAGLLEYCQHTANVAELEKQIDLAEKDFPILWRRVNDLPEKMAKFEAQNKSYKDFYDRLKPYAEKLKKK